MEIREIRAKRKKYVKKKVPIKTKKYQKEGQLVFQNCPAKIREKEQRKE